MACIAACGTAVLPELTEEGEGIVPFYIQPFFFFLQKIKTINFATTKNLLYRPPFSYI